MESTWERGPAAFVAKVPCQSQDDGAQPGLLHHLQAESSRLVTAILDSFSSRNSIPASRVLNMLFLRLIHSSALQVAISLSSRLTSNY